MPLSDAHLLAGIERVVGADNFLLPPLSSAYNSDASLERGSAEVVVFPANIAEVQALVKLCAEAERVIVPRGAGTGYAGGATPGPGSIVLATCRLNSPAPVAAPNGRVRVGVGAIAIAVDRALRRSGYFLPQLPTSANTASIGGCVSTCAGGSHSFGYGNIASAVQAIAYVNGSGEVQEVSRSNRPELLEVLIGSEGTLGVIVIVELQGQPLPAWRRALRVRCADTAEGVELVQVLSSGHPHLTALDLACPAHIPGRGPLGDATLYLDLHAQTESDGQAALKGLDSELCRRKAAVEQLDSDQLGKARLADAIARVRGVMRSTGRDRYFLFDAGIPVNALGDGLDELARMYDHHQVPATNSFHAGDGNLHPTPFFRSGNRRQLAAVRRFWSDTLAAVAAYDGALTGEHGIGREKIDQLGVFYSDEARRLIATARRKFAGGAAFNSDKVDLLGPPRRRKRPPAAPATIQLDRPRETIDVPHDATLGEVLAALDRQDLELGWLPVGQPAEANFVSLLLAGWPADTVRGRARPADRILGFWFSREGERGFFGSGVWKDVSGLGLRRGLASGGWDLARIEAVRLRVSRLDGRFTLVPALGDLASLDSRTLGMIECSILRNGGGAAVCCQGTVDLLLRGSATTVETRQALALPASEYGRLLGGNGSSHPRLHPLVNVEEAAPLIGRSDRPAWLLPTERALVA